MALKYPANCIATADKLGFCYRAKKLLRNFHNQIGKWRRGELTEQEYDALPMKLKNHLPVREWKPQLSRNEWNVFVENVFEPWTVKISEQLNTRKKEAEEDSVKWSERLEDIV